MVSCHDTRQSASERLPFKESGFSLTELIVAVAILGILSSLSVPLARRQMRRVQEQQLIHNLEEIRHAIDRYKDMADANLLGPQKAGSDNYPESLQALVDGVPLAGSYVKMRFLRRIPRDPFLNSTDWGVRCSKDDPNSTSWCGENVFDVFTKTDLLDGSGQPYSEW